ncbi:MAG: HXXEE domain-containing protein [Prevotella sp.]|nr:HXXEE domain-containing protein [Prevotella sp.]
MDKYIWMLPVLFMFHDMEEIIGMEKWVSSRYEDIAARYPIARRMLAPMRNVSTARFAAAVYEEFVLLTVVCLLADVTVNSFVDGLWLGVFVGFAIHLVVHLVQATVIRSYIPALITSIITLPPSIYLIKQSCQSMQMNTCVIVGMAVGIVGVAANLIYVLHRMVKVKSVE